MTNPYLRFTDRMLKSLEKIYREDSENSSLPAKKRENAKFKLGLVREAMKQNN